MLRAEVKSSFPASVAKRMVASLLLVETDMINTHRFLHVVRWKINPKKVNDVANGSDVGPSPLGLLSASRVSAASYRVQALNGESSLQKEPYASGIAQARE